MTGTGWPVHKPGGGGWAQLRYQRRTEDTWEANARELAGRVAAGAVMIEREVTAESEQAAQTANQAVAQAVERRSPGRVELTGRGISEPVSDRADAALARGHHRRRAGFPAPGPGTSIQAPQDGVGATLRHTRELSSDHGLQRSSGIFLLNTPYPLHGSRLQGKRLSVESTVSVLRGIHVCD